MRRLERVDAGNRAAVEALRVAESQRAYLTTPSWRNFLPTTNSIRRLRRMPSPRETRGWIGERRLQARRARRAWIPLIVIDRKHQGRGLGRAAMVAVINLLSADPRGFAGVGLSCQPANEVACISTTSLGFAPTGTVGERRSGAAPAVGRLVAIEGAVGE